MSTPRISQPVQALADAGVGVWLDDLSRELLDSGGLQTYVDRGIVGVTTNPTIFASALSKGEKYDAQVRELSGQGASVDEAVFALTTDDVRRACDVLMPVHQRSNGVDGRVSIEVDPRLAADTQGTVEMAKRLWETIDRPNLMVKIPATIEGLPAISKVLAEGISVNVTLIFSLDRYRAVLGAWLTGLEQAHEAGRDLSSIHSVASFFVSRFDSEVDKRLEAIGTEEALALRGQSAVANARLAYQAFEEVVGSDRWQHLAALGAPVQRPLWASTSVKNPDYPDTMYVVDLVAPDTVNTMPSNTFEAVADHGEVSGDAVRGTYENAQEVMDALARLGIRYDDVTAVLEEEGVSKFVASWDELLQTVSTALDAAKDH